MRSWVTFAASVSAAVICVWGLAHVVANVWVIAILYAVIIVGAGLGARYVQRRNRAVAAVRSKMPRDSR